MPASASRPISPVRRVAGRVKRALSARRVVTVRSGPARGLRIGLHLASADYRSGGNERAVQEAFVAHLQPGQVAYDIGSNVGFFALLAARLVGPAGAVHAFEAVPACAQALERNRARNRLGQITVHPAAVGHRSGTVEVFRARHPGGSTISPRDRPADHRDTISVPCVSIDDLVAGGDVRPPDFVKIDVEGAETAVLFGMADTIARHRPVVLCELDDVSALALDTKQREVAALLEPHGYRISQLDPSYPGSPSLVVHLLARPEPATPGGPGPERG